MTCCQSNISILKSEKLIFLFPTLSPRPLSPFSILCWISLLIGIETKQGSAQLIIKLPEQTFQTWLDWKPECWILMNSEIIPFLSNNRLLGDNSARLDVSSYDCQISLRRISTQFANQKFDWPFFQLNFQISVKLQILYCRWGRAWRPVVQLFFLLKQLIGAGPVPRYI